MRAKPKASLSFAILKIEAARLRPTAGECLAESQRLLWPPNNIICNLHCAIPNDACTMLWHVEVQNPSDSSMPIE